MIVVLEVFDRVVEPGAKLMVNTPAGSNCFAVSPAEDGADAWADAGWVVVVTAPAAPAAPLVEVLPVLPVLFVEPVGVFAAGVVVVVAPVAVPPVFPPVPVLEPVLEPVLLVGVCVGDGVDAVSAGNASCGAVVVVVVVVGVLKVGAVVVVVGAAFTVMVCCT